MNHDDDDTSCQRFSRQARLTDGQIRQRSTVFCMMNEVAQHTRSQAFHRRPASTSPMCWCKLLVGSERQEYDANSKELTHAR